MVMGWDQRRIAVYVNGIPQNDPEDHNVYWIDFPDIASSTDNIQIQRGAGLTSYGSASIGGSINLSTSNFINKKGVKIYTGLGFQQFEAKDNKFRQQISKYSIEAASGIIGDGKEDSPKYAFYSRLSQIKSIGYRDNSWANLQSYFFGAVRFDKNLTTQINLFGGPLTDGLAYNGIPKSYINDPSLRLANYNYWNYDTSGHNVEYLQERRKQEVEGFSQPHIEVLNEYKINDEMNLKSSLFFYSGRGYYDYDGTGWTDASSFQLNEANGYPDALNPQNPLIRAFVDNNQWGWIPRFEITKDDYSLTFGMALRLHLSNHWGKIQYAEDLPINYDPDFKFYEYDGVRNIFSLFANFNMSLTDNLLLFADLSLNYNSYAINNEKSGKFYTKYTDINYKIVGNGNDLFNINYLFVNPKIGLNYLINQNSSVFAFAAMTSREPRMSNLYSASEAFYGAKPQFETHIYPSPEGVLVYYDFNKPLVKPETLFDFELGYNLLTSDLSLNVNLYYMYYKNELVQSGQLDNFGDPIDGNAPQTVHSGLEITAAYDLFKTSNFGKLSVKGNITYSSNKIKEYSYKIALNQSISLQDNPIAGFPNLMANVKLIYNFDNFYFGTTIQHIGKSKTDNFGDMLTDNQALKDYLSYEYYADNNLDAFTIINFDFDYKFNKFLTFNDLLVQLKIKNALNLKYAVGAVGKEFFPGAERNIFLGFELGL